MVCFLLSDSPSRSWLPPNAAAHGFAFDQLLRWNLITLTALFVIAHLLLVVLFLRQRAMPAAAARRVRASIQIAPLVLLIAMYLTMAITAQRLWAHNRFEGAAPQAMQVEVTGRQFQWYFRYPGPDAQFGRIDPVLIAPAEGNPLGLVSSDDYGRDDVVASELVLPVHREVDLTLRAQDVIHGLFLPAMRLKQNAVPGLLLHVHFTPVATGTYPIVCTQVCGLGHARMQAQMRVVSQADFQRWLDAKAKTQARP